MIANIDWLSAFIVLLFTGVYLQALQPQRNRERKHQVYENERARPTAVSPVPPPIAAALNSLEAANSRLNELVTALELRLTMVMAPPPPAGVGDTAKQARNSLALQIESNVSSVHFATDRIDSIINRLEL